MPLSICVYTFANRVRWCRISALYNFKFALNEYLLVTLANAQIDAQILIHLLQSSTCTCFEQCLAHPQEVKLY